MIIVVSMVIAEGHPVLLVTEEESRYVVMAGRFEKLVEQLACQQKPGTVDSCIHTCSLTHPHMLTVFAVSRPLVCEHVCTWVSSFLFW